MIYYKNNNEKFEYKFNEHKDDFIKAGRQGTVYKETDGKCAKFYYLEQPRTLKIYTPHKFELFKELDLKNHCKLHELFYRDEDLKKVGGFIMDYYEPSKTSILDMPIEYVLYNFKILYDNVLTLTENKIINYDLYHRNVIVGDNDITVIDFETYLIKKMYSYKKILNINTETLFELMKLLFEHELKKIYTPSKYEKKLDELFCYEEEPVKTLSKKLKGVKKPIDLF